VTYFPPPYLPPDPGLDLSMLAQPELRRPARQASALLLVLSALTLAVAAMLWLVSFAPIDQWPPEQRDKLQQIIEPTGMPMKQFFIAVASVMTFLAAVFGGLGGLVRTGRRWAIILAIIVDSVVVVLMSINVIHALASPEEGLVAAILPICLTALMIFLMQRLIIALVAAGTARSMAAQWQVMGQPFDPNFSGFGFGAPLPPPPPQAPKKE
jgi:hypothetical protein